MVNRRLAEGVHQPFLQAMHRFHGATATLRQIHSKLAPTVAVWPDEIGEEFREAIKPYEEEQQKALVGLATVAGPLLFRGHLVFKTESQEEESASRGERVDEVRKAWDLVAEQLGGDMGAAYHILEILHRKITTPELEQTFHRSLLMSAVAALDNLVLELMRNFYLVRPEALGGEITFTLEDLSEFADLGDARLDAAERKAEGIIRQGLAGWKKWLTDLKINLESYCVDYAHLVEVFQRRHVAVHNDGKVSRAYRERLLEVASEEAIPAVGERLQIDDTYLEEALDEIEAVGTQLAGAVWTKCLPEAEDIVIHEFYVRSYDLMLAGRWVPTDCLCRLSMKRLGHDDDLYLIFKANSWLARKRQGEDISAEVQGWPTKTLATRFKAVQAALLDNLPEVDRLIRHCLKSEELSVEDVAEWPVLEEFRARGGWTQILEESSGS